MMREIFSEVIMHKDITPEAWKRVTIKVICKKKATQREQKITVQYVRCLRCTQCFQHFSSTGFTTSLTDGNLPTREGFVAHFKTWIIQKHTGQDVDREVRLAQKGFNTIRHDGLWNALARFEVETPYISLWKRLHADQQATVWTDKESDMFKLLFFNTVLQAALEDDFKHWPEKGTGISSGDHQTDCLSNLRFADNVVFIFHIAGSAEKNNDRLQKEHRQ